MSEQEQGKLFQRYVNINHHTSYNEGGSGLGLCITKSLVQLLQGSISVSSIKNQGTTFCVRLPLKVSKTAEQTSLQTNHSTVTVQPSCKRILIVDDNNINRRVLQYLLESFGHECKHATHGLEAIEKVQQEHFDLLFMDLEMPFLGGLEASIRIRQLGFSGPIICISGNTRTEHLKKVLQAGMDEMITKPFRQDQIRDILNKYLQQVL